jgi:hypothetical protein
VNLYPLKCCGSYSISLLYSILTNGLIMDDLSCIYAAGLRAGNLDLPVAKPGTAKNPKSQLDIR